MPSWRDAIAPKDDGIDLLLEVVPNAKATEFPSGYNPWRNRIQARLAAPPTDGRANDELRDAVARRLAVPERDVEIEEGATSRLKRLHVRGTSAAEATRRLEETLG